jgi:hypothetical protein
MRIETCCLRSIEVTGFALPGLSASMECIVLEVPCTAQDNGGLWAPMAHEEARILAALLLFQAAAVDSALSDRPGRVEVVPVAGDAYEIRIRGRVLTTDQPRSDRGSDTATRTGGAVRGLHRRLRGATHGAFPRLALSGSSRTARPGRFRRADDRPARVSELSLTVQAPVLAEDRLPAVPAHCTVSNTLPPPAEMRLRVACEAPPCESATPARPGAVS